MHTNLTSHPYKLSLPLQLSQVTQASTELLSHLLKKRMAAIKLIHVRTERSTAGPEGH